MVSFSKLAELSSGNIGFAGGSAVDTMPGMSFSECANAFNDYLSEQAIADYEREEACDERLFEAAVMSMQYGDSSILESTVAAINEEDGTGDGNSESSSSGSKASVWERIKNVFRKIKEFFANLLAKLTSWIAMYTKDGIAFYNKYSKKMNESKNTVEVKRHSFAYLDNTIKIATSANIDAIMKTIVPGIKDLDKVTSDEARDLASELKVERSKVREAVYAAANIKTDDKIEKYLLGDESTIKISTAKSGAGIKSTLTDPNGVAGLKAAYKANMAAADNKLRIAQGVANNKNDANIANYAKAYSALYNAVSAELNKFFTACIKAYKARVMEAKKNMRSIILGKDVGDDATKAADTSDDDSIEDLDDDDKYAEYQRQREEMEESTDVSDFDFEF